WTTRRGVCSWKTCRGTRRSSRQRSHHRVESSLCLQGASDRKRLSEATDVLTATEPNSPVSVRLPRHSSSPSSTVTKCGHERTAETVRECLGILAQPFVYTYNRDSHRVSPRSRVSVASPLYRGVRNVPTQKLKVQR